MNGNTLTVTAAGITSSTGLSVPFVRDAQGRITKITDPLGKEYMYTYQCCAHDQRNGRRRHCDDGKGPARADDIEQRSGALST